MQKNIFRKSLVVGIIILLFESVVVSGFSGYKEIYMRADDLLKDMSKLSNSSVNDDICVIQKCIDYNMQVVAEEEQYKQLMEEECLQQRNAFKSSYEDFFNNPFLNLLYQRTLQDIHYLFFEINNKNNDIAEERVPKPRPIATGNTLYVGGNGSGNYSKIQDAINDAVDGDVVFVFDDSSPYYENVVVNKSIKIIGEDMNTTIIDGRGRNEVVVITSDYVHIEGFTIQNGYNGIYLDFCSNITIHRNIITNNTSPDFQEDGGGIYMDRSSSIITGNTITNNAIYGDIHSGDAFGGGIYMYKSSSIITCNTITNNTLFGDCDHNIGGGIYMSVSSGIISDNIIIDNSCQYITDDVCGIYMDRSLGTISSNIFTNNSAHGLYMDRSPGTYIVGNTFETNGIFLSGGALIDWNSHIIENNTLNGRPIHYYKNINNIIVPEDSAQVIMANCSNFLIQNTNISSGSIGIALAYCNNNVITGNKITGKNFYGIYLYCSSNNTFKINTVKDLNYNGIVLDCSSNNIFYNNTIINNQWSGLDLRESFQNTISSNKIEKNSLGINLFISNDNIINNNVIANSFLGIQASNSLNNSFSNNNITNNKYGIYLYCSSNNDISSNSFFDDGLFVHGSYHNNVDNNMVNGKPLVYLEDE